MAALDFSPSQFSPNRMGMTSSARSRVMSEVGRTNGGTLSDILWAYDTPRSVIAGTLSGLADGDPGRGLRALGQTEEERVSGRELNAQFGLDPTPGQKTWANFIPGLITETLLDPMSYVSGPIKALSAAGKAADAAGLLRQAPQLLSRQYLAGKAAPEIAERAAATVKRIGRDVSPTDILGRPLVGQRAAQRFGTLGDLIDNSTDTGLAEQNVLASLGGSRPALDRLRSQRLGKTFGVGLPFMDPVASFDLPLGLGTKLGDSMDALGQMFRWSPVGRAAHMFADNKVGQAFDADDQMITAGTNYAKAEAQATARRESAYQAAKLQTASPDVFSEEGNRAMGRLIEQPNEWKQKAQDNVWLSDHPAARQYMDWWKEKSAASPEEFRQLGLEGSVFDDPNISGYLPRKADGLLERAGLRDPSLGRVLSSLTSDQMHRAPEIMVPGGRDTLAFELSKDPFIAGGKRGAKNDEEAAQYIAEKLYGKRFHPNDEGFRAFDQEYAEGSKYFTKNPSVSPEQLAEANVYRGSGAFGGMLTPENAESWTFSPGANKVSTYVGNPETDSLWKTPMPREFQDLFTFNENGTAPHTLASYAPEQVDQARALAKLLHRLPDNVIKDAPLFGQHPVDMIGRYMEGRAGAAATQSALYDSLAIMAVRSPAELAPGGRHISAAEALTRLSARTVMDNGVEVGAKQQLRERLAKRFGMPPDKIDLSSISVPENVVNRLTRARATVEDPKAASMLGELMEGWGDAWKSGLLSWPSKIVRDMYSGAYSNWLEGAFSKRGTIAGKAIYTSGASDPNVQAALAQMPLYKGLDPSERAARFLGDYGSTTLGASDRSADTNMIISGGRALSAIPGAVPDTFAGAIGELASQPGRSWNQYRKDLLTPMVWPTKETVERSPIARAGQKAGSLADKINRMSGYMELLMQGVAPEEAAQRMLRAHVDYGSLTPYEKNIRDHYMPFYAYASRSMQEVLRQMATRPGGRYMQGIRAYERAQEPEEGQYVPSNIRQNFAARLPANSFFGTSDPSVERYLTDIDLPGMDQLNMIHPRDLQQTANNLLMQTNPAIRTGLEFATGRDFFTGQKLKQSNFGPLGKIGRALTGDEDFRPPAMLEKSVELVPFVSRPLRAIANLSDQDNGLSFGTRALSGAINATSGIKFRDVSQDDIRRDFSRRVGEIADPYTLDHTTPYIPEDRKAETPENILEAMAAVNSLQTDHHKASKKKKKFSVDQHLDSDKKKTPKKKDEFSVDAWRP